MVLSYRTGAAGKGGKSMADYLSQGDVPELSAKLSAYLSSSMAPAAPGQTAAIPRRDMHPLIADLLKIDPNRALSQEEMANLLAGHRTDGKAIPGKRLFASTKDHTRIAYTDFTFSAPKSFSIALAFASTEAERAILEECWIRANDVVVSIIAAELGMASKGDSAKDGYDPAHIAAIRYDHYTSRPTVKLAMDGDTKLMTVPTEIPGDMNRHCHNIIPHVCITDDGRVSAIPLERMQERLHEWGYLGHAFLATFLREKGIRAEIDPRNGLSCLPDVPRWACELFQNRTDDGERFARAYAAEQGLDWDALDPKAKARMLDSQVARTRRAKDGKTDYAAWVERAQAAGYEHKSVIRPEGQRGVPEAGEQARQGYDVALPFVADHLERRATLPGSVLRQAAAQSMIHTGLRTAGDHERVVEAFFSEGVLQDGQMTALVAAPEEGRRFNSITTEMHAELEQEAINLLKAAAADKSAALTPADMQAAMQRVAKRKGYDFTTKHGRQQAEMATAFGVAGRAIVGIGAAGSGKSVTLEPVIDAHHAAGWSSYGTTLAWRQTHALKDAGVGRKRRGFNRTPDTSRLTEAGISDDHAFALTVFLKKAEAGEFDLHPKTLVVIDEIATLGTNQVLELARLQAKNGFKIVGMGDPAQAQSIQAGNTIKLFRHALGKEQVPEILDTIRQKRQEDRDTARLFRDGKAGDALKRKDERGLLRLTPGGYSDAIKEGVDEWEKRIAANENREKYSIGISVPTNADAHAVGLEIRQRLRAAGRITGGDFRIQAQDQRGITYDMDLAVGDTVRLFNRVNARFGKDSRGYFGENGTTAEIVSIDTMNGLRLKRADGKIGAVKWGSLQDKGSGRVRLAYGSALTIDARQGDTLTDHITILAAGSKAINAFKMYPADTRNREDSVLVVSHGAEKEVVRNRRPLADPWLSGASEGEMGDAIMDNMARNLSQRPEKGLAVDFLSAGMDVFRGSVNSMQAAWFRAEQAAAEGKEPDLGSRFQESREEAAVVSLLAEMKRSSIVINGAVKLLTHEEKPHQTRPERRRQAAIDRKKAKRQVRQERTIDPAVAKAEFADAIHRAGLKLPGEPIMDGQKRYVPLLDGNPRKLQGEYHGYLDNWPAGFIRNFKTGFAEAWKASQPTRELSSTEREKASAERAERSAAKAAQTKADQARAAKKAYAKWMNGYSVPQNDYLSRKGVRAHGLRQDGNGNLMVPMRDANGFLRNIQTITPAGDKLFLKDARKLGLFATLGKITPEKPILIAEGYATAATLYEATGLPVIVAFDTSNLLPAATAIREKYADATIIFAADNDHHLPRKEKPQPNYGFEKAQAAAEKVGAIVIKPDFGEIEKQLLIEGKGVPTDFNDLQALIGKEKVGAIIAAELKAQGITMPEKKLEAADRTRTVTEAERNAARQAHQAAPPMDQAQRNAQHAQQEMERRARQHNQGRSI